MFCYIQELLEEVRCSVDGYLSVQLARQYNKSHKRQKGYAQTTNTFFFNGLLSLSINVKAALWLNDLQTSAFQIDKFENVTASQKNVTSIQKNA